MPVVAVIARRGTIAGITVGSLVAIVAVLLSLPFHSPHDAASAGIGAVMVGMLSGWLVVAAVAAGRSTIAGITTGSLAAIVAVLVSLPLHSPDDARLNSASVGIGAILVGMLSGLMWRLLKKTKQRTKNYTILWGVSCVTVSSMLLSAFSVQMDNLVPFALPLAAIVCLITGVLTPILARDSSPLRWWAAPVAVALALAVAIPLAGVGDQPSGRLELPPKTGLVQPAPTMYLAPI